MGIRFLALLAGRRVDGRRARVAGWWAAAALCLLAALAGVGVASVVRAEDIAVIVNVGGPLTSLTLPDVRALYLGERQFVGPEMVVVLHLPEGDAKATFLSRVVGRTLKEYKLHWLQRVFQEGATLPKVVAGPEAMLGVVATRRNSVGYLPASLVHDMPEVKVLFVVPSP
jgi:hypothetical protein